MSNTTNSTNTTREYQKSKIKCQDKFKIILNFVVFEFCSICNNLYLSKKKCQKNNSKNSKLWYIRINI